MYARSLEIFKSSLTTKTELQEFEDYLDDVDHVIRYGYETEEDRLIVTRVNEYEKKKYNENNICICVNCFSIFFACLCI